MTLNDVLTVFEEADLPVLTASEVAEELDCLRPSAYNKLERLVEQGTIKKEGRGKSGGLYLDG